MKILIIDEDGVKEFLPSEQIQQTLDSQISDSEAKPEHSSQRGRDQDELKVYTMAQLIKIFQTSRPNIYSWIGKGWLKQTTIGGRKYFRKQDVELMLERGVEE